MRLKFCVIMLLVLAFGVQLQGQSRKQFLNKANERFAEHDYFNAYKYYSIVLEFDSSQTDIRYRIGESARLLHSYRIAKENYEVVRLDSVESAKHELLDFHLGIVNKRLQNFDTAVYYFQSFIDANPNREDYYVEKAKLEIEACPRAAEMMRDKETFEINRMVQDINSVNSESGGALIGDTFYFASLRFKLKKDDHNPPRPISKVMFYTPDGGVQELGNEFNSDTAYTKSFSITLDRSHVYFSKCHYVGVAEFDCEIYRRTILEDGSFGPIEGLPETINMPGTTNDYGRIGKNPATGNEVLFFSSDRPGGKGRMDLWMSEIDTAGQFGEPVNLEKLNTFDDEITPYYQHTTNTLYFSSEGYEGLGGYDVFKSYFSNNEWSDAKHLRRNVNSSYNDFHFIIDPTSSIGFVTSNRPGSAYLENELEACCFDIYEVHQIGDLERIHLTTYEMVPVQHRLNPDQFNILLTPQVILPPSNGEFSFVNDSMSIIEYTPREGEIGLDSVYTMRCFDEIGQICDTTVFVIEVVPLPVDTIRRQTDMNVPVDVCWEIAPLVGDTEVSICGEPSHGTFELKEGNCLTYKPDKNFIGLDELCVIVCDKNGACLRKTIIIDVLPNVPLEQLLPVAMYFDNDEPDQNSESPITDKTYNDTYDAYYARKNTFLNRYSRGLTGVDRQTARDSIGRFFENHVKKGFEVFNQFSETVERYMLNDQKVEVILKGYTSPRSDQEYNYFLAQRRISCVRNHFDAYKNGFFRQYIESGQLVISEQPFGETTAPEGIADDLFDVRNSIYSPEASRERRLEIVEVVR